MEITLPNNWTPRAYQLPAWRYMQGGGTHAELVWHRRSGKDDLALHWTACAAMTRTGNYWHTLPRANQARKAIWEAVNPHTGKRRIDEAFPQEIRRSQHDQEMLIRFANGSTWQVVGSDNFDSLVGSPPIGLTFSEWALCQPAAWAYLRPIIAENKGWAIFNTTPRGKNHAYHTFRAAQKEHGHYAQLLRAQDTDVFSADALIAERRQLIEEYGDDYGASIYEQEYECSFEAANLGAILGRALVKAEHDGRVCNVAYDGDGHGIVVSSDIGFRDTAGWWFWQPKRDGFALLGYIGESGLDADEWVIKLREYLSERGWKLDTVWLPQDAKARTFASRRSAVECFLAAFGADHVAVTPSVKIADRINAARKIMRTCWFDEAATEKGRDGLSAWSYDYNEETKTFMREPRHDWASHPGDAFSYGATVLMEYAPKIEVPEPMRGIIVGANQVTLDEMWREAPSLSSRI